MSISAEAIPATRRKRWPAAAALMAAVAVVILLHPLWLMPVGQFLVVSTPLEKADLVVVMGGGGTNRVNRGIELYQQGFARSHKLAITGGRVDTDIFAEGSWAELGARYATSKGIPTDDVLQANWTESTYDDIEAVAALMKERGYSSAILVSDIFHMRRTKWVAEKAMPEYRLMFAAAPTPLLEVNEWWTREREFLFVFLEYIKMAMYLVKYGP